jgi:hypothetical protein
MRKKIRKHLLEKVLRQKSIEYSEMYHLCRIAPLVYRKFRMKMVENCVNSRPIKNFFFSLSEIFFLITMLMFLQKFPQNPKNPHLIAVMLHNIGIYNLSRTLTKSKIINYTLVNCQVPFVLDLVPEYVFLAVC